ncbi:MAG: PEP-CTERM sorting domain-containing protein [Glaciecola sp.]
MKNKFLKGLVAGFALLLSGIANAGLITLSEFDATATTYDFSGLTDGATTVGDGFLTVSNGEVISINEGSLIAPAYYDGEDSSVIRFDFLTLVSAIGLDFYVNDQPTTLSIFDSTDSLIESITISNIGLPTSTGFPYGFIGVNAGANLISYATVDTPLIGNELVVDNIIYQSTTEVPEPSTLAVFTLGLMGLASRKLKKQA